MSDTRNAIVEWAHWLMAHKQEMHYSEGADRLNAIGVWPPRFPIATDCSGFVTLCYWLAGAPDPTNKNYATHEGYTGTELTVGTEIPLQLVEPGDAIVYGPGTGWHTALVVEAGADPLTISHGQQGDPSLVRVSQDGRQPQRYLRFKTEGTVRTPADLDKKPAPKPVEPVAVAPQPVADLTHIQSAPQAHQTPLEAPVAPAAPQVEEPATNKAHMGWPLLKEVETIVEELIEGPAES